MKTRWKVKSGPFEETFYTNDTLTHVEAAVRIMGRLRPPKIGKIVTVTKRGPDGESTEFIDAGGILVEINASAYGTNLPGVSV